MQSEKLVKYITPSGHDNWMERQTHIPRIGEQITRVETEWIIRGTVYKVRWFSINDYEMAEKVIKLYQKEQVRVYLNYVEKERCV